MRRDRWRVWITSLLVLYQNSITYLLLPSLQVPYLHVRCYICSTSQLTSHNGPHTTYFVATFVIQMPHAPPTRTHTKPGTHALIYITFPYFTNRGISPHSWRQHH